MHVDPQDAGRKSRDLTPPSDRGALLPRSWDVLCANRTSSSDDDGHAEEVKRF
jgi:hypothetical protein